MSSRRTKLSRISKEIDEKCKKLMPGRSSAERHELLYRYSLFRVEDKLNDLDLFGNRRRGKKK